jgi:hypothetical protein
MSMLYDLSTAEIIKEYYSENILELDVYIKRYALEKLLYDIDNPILDFITFNYISMTYIVQKDFHILELIKAILKDAAFDKPLDLETNTLNDYAVCYIPHINLGVSEHFNGNGYKIDFKYVSSQTTFNAIHDMDRMIVSESQYRSDQKQSVIDFFNKNKINYSKTQGFIQLSVTDEYKDSLRSKIENITLDNIDIAPSFETQQFNTDSMFGGELLYDEAGNVIEEDTTHEVFTYDGGLLLGSYSENFLINNCYINTKKYNEDIRNMYAVIDDVLNNTEYFEENINDYIGYDFMQYKLGGYGGLVGKCSVSASNCTIIGSSVKGEMTGNVAGGGLLGISSCCGKGILRVLGCTVSVTYESSFLDYILFKYTMYDKSTLTPEQILETLSRKNININKITGMNKSFGGIIGSQSCSEGAELLIDSCDVYIKSYNYLFNNLYYGPQGGEYRSDENGTLQYNVQKAEQDEFLDYMDYPEYIQYYRELTNKLECIKDDDGNDVPDELNPDLSAYEQILSSGTSVNFLNDYDKKIFLHQQEKLDLKKIHTVGMGGVLGGYSCTEDSITIIKNTEVNGKITSFYQLNKSGGIVGSHCCIGTNDLDNTDKSFSPRLIILNCTSGLNIKAFGIHTKVEKVTNDFIGSMNYQGEHRDLKAKMNIFFAGAAGFFTGLAQGIVSIFDEDNEFLKKNQLEETLDRYGPTVNNIKSIVNPCNSIDQKTRVNRFVEEFQQKLAAGVYFNSINYSGGLVGSDCCDSLGIMLISKSSFLGVIYTDVGFDYVGGLCGRYFCNNDSLAIINNCVVDCDFIQNKEKSHAPPSCGGFIGRDSGNNDSTLMLNFNRLLNKDDRVTEGHKRLMQTNTISLTNNQFNFSTTLDNQLIDMNRSSDTFKNNVSINTRYMTPEEYATQGPLYENLTSSERDLLQDAGIIDEHGADNAFQTSQITQLDKLLKSRKALVKLRTVQTKITLNTVRSLDETPPKNEFERVSRFVDSLKQSKQNDVILKNVINKNTSTFKIFDIKNLSENPFLKNRNVTVETASTFIGPTNSDIMPIIYDTNEFQYDNSSIFDSNSGKYVEVLTNSDGTTTLRYSDSNEPGLLVRTTAVNGVDQAVNNVNNLQDLYVDMIEDKYNTYESLEQFNYEPGLTNLNNAQFTSKKSESMKLLEESFYPNLQLNQEIDFINQVANFKKLIILDNIENLEYTKTLLDEQVANLESLVNSVELVTNPDNELLELSANEVETLDYIGKSINFFNLTLSELLEYTDPKGEIVVPDDLKAIITELLSLEGAEEEGINGNLTLTGILELYKTFCQRALDDNTSIINRRFNPNIISKETSWDEYTRNEKFAMIVGSILGAVLSIQLAIFVDRIQKTNKKYGENIKQLKNAVLSKIDTIYKGEIVNNALTELNDALDDLFPELSNKLPDDIKTGLVDKIENINELSIVNLDEILTSVDNIELDIIGQNGSDGIRIEGFLEKSKTQELTKFIEDVKISSEKFKTETLNSKTQYQDFLSSDFGGKTLDEQLLSYVTQPDQSNIIKNTITDKFATNFSKKINTDGIIDLTTGTYVNEIGEALNIHMEKSAIVRSSNFIGQMTNDLLKSYETAEKAKYDAANVSQFNENIKNTRLNLEENKNKLQTEINYLKEELLKEEVEKTTILSDGLIDPESNITLMKTQSNISSLKTQIDYLIKHQEAFNKSTDDTLNYLNENFYKKKKLSEAVKKTNSTKAGPSFSFAALRSGSPNDPRAGLFELFNELRVDNYTSEVERDLLTARNTPDFVANKPTIEDLLNKLENPSIGRGGNDAYNRYKKINTDNILQARENILTGYGLKQSDELPASTAENFFHTLDPGYELNRNIDSLFDSFSTDDFNQSITSFNDNLYSKKILQEQNIFTNFVYNSDLSPEQNANVLKDSLLIDLNEEMEGYAQTYRSKLSEIQEEYSKSIDVKNNKMKVIKNKFSVQVLSDKLDTIKSVNEEILTETLDSKIIIEERKKVREKILLNTDSNIFTEPSIKMQEDDALIKSIETKLSDEQTLKVLQYSNQELLTIVDEFNSELIDIETEGLIDPNKLSVVQQKLELFKKAATDTSSLAKVQDQVNKIDNPILKSVGDKTVSELDNIVNPQVITGERKSLGFRYSLAESLVDYRETVASRTSLYDVEDIEADWYKETTDNLKTRRRDSSINLDLKLSGFFDDDVVEYMPQFVCGRKINQGAIIIMTRNDTCALTLRKKSNLGKAELDNLNKIDNIRINNTVKGDEIRVALNKRNALRTSNVKRQLGEITGTFAELDKINLGDPDATFEFKQNIIKQMNNSKLMSGKEASLFGDINIKNGLLIDVKHIINRIRLKRLFCCSSLQAFYNRVSLKDVINKIVANIKTGVTNAIEDAKKGLYKTFITAPRDLVTIGIPRAFMSIGSTIVSHVKNPKKIAKALFKLVKGITNFVTSLLEVSPSDFLLEMIFPIFMHIVVEQGVMQNIVMPILAYNQEKTYYNEMARTFTNNAEVCANINVAGSFKVIQKYYDAFIFQQDRDVPNRPWHPVTGATSLESGLAEVIFNVMPTGLIDAGVTLARTFGAEGEVIDYIENELTNIKKKLGFYQPEDGEEVEYPFSRYILTNIDNINSGIDTNRADTNDDEDFDTRTTIVINNYVDDIKEISYINDIKPLLTFKDVYIYIRSKNMLTNENLLQNAFGLNIPLGCENVFLNKYRDIPNLREELYSLNKRDIYDETVPASLKNEIEAQIDTIMGNISIKESILDYVDYNVNEIELYSSGKVIYKRGENLTESSIFVKNEYGDLLAMYSNYEWRMTSRALLNKKVSIINDVLDIKNINSTWKTLRIDGFKVGNYNNVLEDINLQAGITIRSDQIIELRNCNIESVINLGEMKIVSSDIGELQNTNILTITNDCNIESLKNDSSILIQEVSATIGNIDEIINTNDGFLRHEKPDGVDISVNTPRINIERLINNGEIFLSNIVINYIVINNNGSTLEIQGLISTLYDINEGLTLITSNSQLTHLLYDIDNNQQNEGLVEGSIDNDEEFFNTIYGELLQNKIETKFLIKPSILTLPNNFIDFTDNIVVSDITISDLPYNIKSGELSKKILDTLFDRSDSESIYKFNVFDDNNNITEVIPINYPSEETSIAKNINGKLSFINDVEDASNCALNSRTLAFVEIVGSDELKAAKNVISYESLQSGTKIEKITEFENITSDLKISNNLQPKYVPNARTRRLYTSYSSSEINSFSNYIPAPNADGWGLKTISDVRNEFENNKYVNTYFKSPTYDNSNYYNMLYSNSTINTEQVLDYMISRPDLTYNDKLVKKFIFTNHPENNDYIENYLKVGMTNYTSFNEMTSNILKPYNDNGSFDYTTSSYIKENEASVENYEINELIKLGRFNNLELNETEESKKMYSNFIEDSFPQSEVVSSIIPIKEYNTHYTKSTIIDTYPKYNVKYFDNIYKLDITLGDNNNENVNNLMHVNSQQLINDYNKNTIIGYIEYEVVQIHQYTTSLTGASQTSLSNELTTYYENIDIQNIELTIGNTANVNGIEFNFEKVYTYTIKSNTKNYKLLYGDQIVESLYNYPTPILSMSLIYKEDLNTDNYNDIIRYTENSDTSDLALYEEIENVINERITNTYTDHNLLSATKLTNSLSKILTGEHYINSYKFVEITEEPYNAGLTDHTFKTSLKYPGYTTEERDVVIYNRRRVYKTFERIFPQIGTIGGWINVNSNNLIEMYRAPTKFYNYDTKQYDWVLSEEFKAGYIRCYVLKTPVATIILQKINIPSSTTFTDLTTNLYKEEIEKLKDILDPSSYTTDDVDTNILYVSTNKNIIPRVNNLYYNEQSIGHSYHYRDIKQHYGDDDYEILLVKLPEPDFELMSSKNKNTKVFAYKEIDTPPQLINTRNTSNKCLITYNINDELVEYSKSHEDLTKYHNGISEIFSDRIILQDYKSEYALKNLVKKNGLDVSQTNTLYAKILIMVNSNNNTNKIINKITIDDDNFVDTSTQIFESSIFKIDLNFNKEVYSPKMYYNLVNCPEANSFTGGELFYNNASISLLRTYNELTNELDYNIYTKDVDRTFRFSSNINDKYSSIIAVNFIKSKRSQEGYRNGLLDNGASLFGTHKELFEIFNTNSLNYNKWVGGENYNVVSITNTKEWTITDSITIYDEYDSIDFNTFDITLEIEDSSLNRDFMTFSVVKVKDLEINDTTRSFYGDNTILLTLNEFNEYKNNGKIDSYYIDEPDTIPFGGITPPQNVLNINGTYKLIILTEVLILGSIAVNDTVNNKPGVSGLSVDSNIKCNYKPIISYIDSNTDETVKLDSLTDKLLSYKYIADYSNLLFPSTLYDPITLTLNSSEIYDDNTMRNLIEIETATINKKQLYWDKDFTTPKIALLQTEVEVNTDGSFTGNTLEYPVILHNPNAYYIRSVNEFGRNYYRYNVPWFTLNGTEEVESDIVTIETLRTTSNPLDTNEYYILRLNEQKLRRGTYSGRVIFDHEDALRRIEFPVTINFDSPPIIDNPELLETSIIYNSTYDLVESDKIITQDTDIINHVLYINKYYKASLYTENSVYDLNKPRLSNTIRLDGMPTRIKINKGQTKPVTFDLGLYDGNSYSLLQKPYKFNVDIPVELLDIQPSILEDTADEKLSYLIKSNSTLIEITDESELNLINHSNIDQYRYELTLNIDKASSIATNTIQISEISGFSNFSFTVDSFEASDKKYVIPFESINDEGSTFVNIVIQINKDDNVIVGTISKLIFNINLKATYEDKTCETQSLIENINIRGSKPYVNNNVIYQDELGMVNFDINGSILSDYTRPDLDFNLNANTKYTILSRLPDYYKYSIDSRYTPYTNYTYDPRLYMFYLNIEETTDSEGNVIRTDISKQNISMPQEFNYGKKFMVDIERFNLFFDQFRQVPIGYNNNNWSWNQAQLLNKDTGVYENVTFKNSTFDELLFTVVISNEYNSSDPIEIRVRTKAPEIKAITNIITTTEKYVGEEELLEIIEALDDEEKVLYEVSGSDEPDYTPILYGDLFNFEQTFEIETYFSFLKDIEITFNNSSSDLFELIYNPIRDSNNNIETIGNIQFKQTRPINVSDLVGTRVKYYTNEDVALITNIMVTITDTINQTASSSVNVEFTINRKLIETILEDELTEIYGYLFTPFGTIIKNTDVNNINLEDYKAEFDLSPTLIENFSEKLNQYIVEDKDTIINQYNNSLPIEISSAVITSLNDINSYTTTENKTSYNKFFLQLILHEIKQLLPADAIFRINTKIQSSDLTSRVINTTADVDILPASTTLEISNCMVLSEISSETINSVILNDLQSDEFLFIFKAYSNDEEIKVIKYETSDTKSGYVLYYANVDNLGNLELTLPYLNQFTKEKIYFQQDQTIIYKGFRITLGSSTVEQTSEFITFIDLLEVGEEITVSQTENNIVSFRLTDINSDTGIKTYEYTYTNSTSVQIATEGDIVTIGDYYYIISNYDSTITYDILTTNNPIASSDSLVNFSYENPYATDTGGGDTGGGDTGGGDTGGGDTGGGDTGGGDTGGGDTGGGDTGGGDTGDVTFTQGYANGVLSIDIRKSTLQSNIIRSIQKISSNNYIFRVVRK